MGRKSYKAWQTRKHKEKKEWIELKSRFLLENSTKIFYCNYPHSYFNLILNTIINQDLPAFEFYFNKFEQGYKALGIQLKEHFYSNTLYSIIKYDNLRFLEFLIDSQGFAVDWLIYSRSLLFHACSLGNERIVNFLLTQSADIDLHHGSILKTTINMGHFNIAMKLLSAGAILDNVKFLLNDGNIFDTPNANCIALLELARLIDKLVENDISPFFDLLNINKLFSREFFEQHSINELDIVDMLKTRISNTADEEDALQILENIHTENTFINNIIELIVGKQWVYQI